MGQRGQQTDYAARRDPINCAVLRLNEADVAPVEGNLVKEDLIEFVARLLWVERWELVGEDNFAELVIPFVSIEAAKILIDEVTQSIVDMKDEVGFNGISSKITSGVMDHDGCYITDQDEHVEGELCESLIFRVSEDGASWQQVHAMWL